MPMFLRTLLQGLVLIVVLVIIGFVAQRGDLGGVFNQEWIDAHVRGPGRNGELLYLVGAALFVAFGLPRQVVSFLGGYAVGLNLGVFLALAATAMGCFISFFFARFIGRNIVSKRFPKRIKKADTFLKNNTFVMTLLIRLLPLGSNFITNLVAGVSSARAMAFITGSTIGYIPQTVIFALLGSGINLEPAFRITLSVVLFVLSAALGIYLYRRYRKNPGLNGALQ